MLLVEATEAGLELVPGLEAEENEGRADVTVDEVDACVGLAGSEVLVKILPTPPLSPEATDEGLELDATIAVEEDATEIDVDVSEVNVCVGPADVEAPESPPLEPLLLLLEA